MSDRYRPNGPRSDRDFLSKQSYNEGTNFDSYKPTGPKRYSERDNYRPNGKPDQDDRDRDNQSHRNQRDQRDNRHRDPRHRDRDRHNDPRQKRFGRDSGDRDHDKRPTGPSVNSQPLGAPKSNVNPNKRPLPPAEPSGIRKRRELNSNSSSYNEYDASYGSGYSGFKSKLNSGYVNGYESRGGAQSGRGGAQAGRGGAQAGRGGSQSNRGGSQSARGGSQSVRGSSRGSSRGGFRNKFEPKPKVPAGPRGSKRKGPAPNVSNKPARLLSSQIFSVKFNNASEIYSRIQQVGEGTYGKVYKAKNAVTGEYVALKKLRLETEREGFPITAIREIKLLQSFDHENIVGLLELMVEHNQIYMIFDYLDHDLTGLLSHPDMKLEECHRKFIFQQLMDGLNYLHKKRVLHRDIKGSNILLDNVGRVKIADFGLARTMKIVNDNELPDYTNRVITIWYRPPELLLGATDYGREIDIWGVGCLLVELYSKTAIFKGFDEISQLCKIFNIMGTPGLDDWPDISELPWFEMLRPKVNKASQFASQYESIMTPSSFDLAKRLLTLNPKTRLTAEQALQHPYFTEEPVAQPLEFLRDLQGEWHEFETKKRRRKERKRIQEEESKSKERGGRNDRTEPTTEPRTERTEPFTDPRTEPRTGPSTELPELALDSVEADVEVAAERLSEVPTGPTGVNEVATEMEVDSEVAEREIAIEATEAKEVPTEAITEAKEALIEIEVPIEASDVQEAPIEIEVPTEAAEIPKEVTEIPTETTAPIEAPIEAATAHTAHTEPTEPTATTEPIEHTAPTETRPEQDSKEQDATL